MTIDQDNFYRKEIVLYLEMYWKAYHHSPSVRDIAKYVGQKRLGRMASTSVIDYHLDILEREGIIRPRDGKARDIVLTNMRISFVEVE